MTMDHIGTAVKERANQTPGHMPTRLGAVDENREALLAQLIANYAPVLQTVHLNVMSALAIQPAKLRDQHFRAPNLERIIYVSDSEIQAGLFTPSQSYGSAGK